MMATAMRPAYRLTFLDSPFVNFRDHDFPDGRGHGFRWVHIKCFRLPAETTDTVGNQDLLAALIAHPEFRDTYDGAEVWLEPRHGQWWSDRITPDTYLAVDEATAAGVVSGWAASEPATLPVALEARLREAVYEPIRRATSRYVLAPLPEDARHDYGPIHGEFHELVLIDSDLGVLDLVVAADD